MNIDEGIAKLIRECWRLGLTTRCCSQGIGEAVARTSSASSVEGLAYIRFASCLEARLFATCAGPMAWSERSHGKRDRESLEQREPWRWRWWRWTLEWNTVRFPARDIPRAEAALRTHGAPLTERIGPVLARRRDACYCSRRCQLAAPRRGASR